MFPARSEASKATRPRPVAPSTPEPAVAIRCLLGAIGLARLAGPSYLPRMSKVWFIDGLPDFAETPVARMLAKMVKGG